MPKISVSKLNLNVKLSTTNLKMSYNKACFKLLILSKKAQQLLKQKVAQNVTTSMCYFIFSKESQQTSKSSPIGTKLLNLVTLPPKEVFFAAFKSTF